MEAPLRVAIDARMIDCSGIGTYVRGLLKALGRIDPPVDAVALRPEAPIYGLREQLAVPRAFARLAPPARLLHVPHYNAPLFFGRAPLVITVHDLIHLRFPGLARRRGARLYARLMSPRACRLARAVICVSQATRRDLLEIVPDAEPKVRVIPHGCDFAPPSAEGRRATLERLGLVPGYVLYAGNVRPHKNVDVLIRALRRFAATDRPKLVLAGEDQMPLFWPARSDPEVRMLGRLPIEDLPALYSGAGAFVFPSLYEGFGLPPLEAMACGAPVICSNAGSLPEVVGEAAILFPPEDEEALACALRRVLAEPGLADALRAKGFERARRFLWEKTASETAELYRFVLEEAARNRSPSAKR
jgi:glycosyltransferase involved in cell wall biosynthesis